MITEEEDPEMLEALKMSLMSTKERKQEPEEEEEDFPKLPRISHPPNPKKMRAEKRKLLEMQLRAIEEEDRRERMEREREERRRREANSKLEKDRMIREQQDMEYYASLEKDRQKVELVALSLSQKEEEKTNEMKKAKVEDAIKEAAQQLELDRQRKKENLPPEPQKGENDETIELVIKMPNNTRFSRRFLLSSSVQQLRDFIESLGVEVTLITP